PAVADAEAVEAGAGRVGAVLPEHADAHHHDARVEVVGTHVPGLHRAGPEVLADDVGVGGQPAEQLLALGPAQVAGDALAAPALHRPEERVLLAAGRCLERADGAHEVALARHLDLDHLGAQLARRPAQNGAEMRVPASMTRRPASGAVTTRPDRPRARR